MFVSLDKDTDVKIVKSRTKHLYTFHFMSKYLFSQISFCPTTFGLSNTGGTKGTSFRDPSDVQGVFKGLLEKVLKGETLGDE